MGLFSFLKGKPSPSPSEEDKRRNLETHKIPASERWEKIICPYCFEEFSHKDVHFRSGTLRTNVLSDEDLEDKYEDDETQLEIEKRKNAIARKFMLQKQDEKLYDFWHGRFGIELNDENHKNWNYPIIYPNDDSMLYHNKSEDGLVYQNGFLARVKDYYGVNSTVRLCPHCHNQLSATYGRNKVLFISVVGITGSGKTVYLNQLLKSLSKHLSGAGLTVSQSFNMRANEKIQKGAFLPMGTQEGMFYPPMMINITPSGKSEEETTTLVFYDIAGENCIDENKLFKFGPYLQKSQAIIMLMDPEQFETINEGTESNSPVEKVTNALIDFFLASGNDERPLMAATLSKSDKLRELAKGFLLADTIQEKSVIFQKINWDARSQGFYHESYKQMQGAMTTLMKKLDPYEIIQKPLYDNFSETAFFAVSALGVEVIPKYNIGSNEEVVYIDLIPSAVKAIKLLKDPAADEKPPLYHGSKEEVELGLHPETGETVLKSFNDICQDNNKILYWLDQNPIPCRIEEPLLWILWQLGLIQAVDA